MQVDNGEFDGADFNYKWDDTKLGVKNSKETTYQFVELKGDKRSIVTGKQIGRAHV